MSQERRERQKEKQGIKTSSRNWWRIAIYAVLIAAAFGLAYYLGNRSQHKHDAFARCLTERGVKM
jgi:anti-sigma-K factor RskA